MVTAAIKRSHAKLLACFTKGKLGDAVEARASFTIGSDGTVTNVATAVGPLPSEVDGCLIAVVGKLRFAKRTAPVEVTVPLAYDPAVRTTLMKGPHDGLPAITGTGDSGTGSVFYVDGKPVVMGKPGWGNGLGMTGQPAARPTVRIGQPTTQGNLDQAIIRRYTRRALPKLLFCYEQELATKKTLQGTSTAVFSIGEDGKVSELSVSGLDANVDGCIADVLGAVEFPAPKGGTVSVRYPLTFLPPGKR